jgi:hypothetical protein
VNRPARAPTVQAVPAGGAFAVALACSFGACSLGACSAAPGPATLVPEVPRVAVRIDFEPALAVPGELHVVHECGERQVVTTGCAGLDLSLPEGPAAFTLLTAGAQHELALRVTRGMPPVEWHLH